MDRGPLSEADAETLETWLAGDARRLGALMRARALFSRTEAAWSLEPVFSPDAFTPLPPAADRRQMLRWATGGALAACFGTAIIGYGLTASEAYATGRGEMRQVPLADGSKLTLNTLSKVEIGAYLHARDVRLVTGEVLLSLAGEQTQEYALLVGDWRLRAGAATFFVSRLPERPAQITVHRGMVDVAGPSSDGLRLAQGSRLLLTSSADLSQQVEQLSAEQLSRELSWLAGQLAFHDESLAEAAQAFARYSRRSIVIRDPALARETVSGLYAANDPAGFARAIGTAFGVEVRVEPDRILIG